MPGGMEKSFGCETEHQQCDVNYCEIRRATVWSYEFHRRIDGRVSLAEATGPYEKLPIPTDLEIVHITLPVVGCMPRCKHVRVTSQMYGRRVSRTVQLYTSLENDKSKCQTNCSTVQLTVQLYM